MRHIARLDEITRASAEWRNSRKTVGFVPTMGALHEGHLSLVREAARRCDVVVASVFVNPLQFGEGEDFEKYPRNLEKDKVLLADSGADVLFTTTAAEMYPPDFSTRVLNDRLSGMLCGRTRPDHFSGMLTVVMKLFNLVGPTHAFFGQKDFQQSVLIMRMVEDLNVPVEVVVCPVIRERDGLAMSSRNAYLTEDERRQAPVIFEALKEGRDLILDGEVKKPETVIRHMERKIGEAPLSRIDYVEIVKRDNLKTAYALKGVLAVCAAVYFGDTRLIDNVFVDADELTAR